ncbi:DUF6336 family protein [Streptomyces sp. TRM68416]|uniref:DUF6336 family protein n=1 Tax=Streptomyces sp. TRM68416 TaxID=2758412 RepID=UPI001661CCA5|nr:DUF6336 family protein [Streptomyces sp. TRM68416]MBD0840219.1 hypothetical protein [Streptomyces sp. TRM68416]
MALDEDGVITPRLRLRDVLLRGLLFGLVGSLLLFAGQLLIGDHGDRLDFLAVLGGLSLVFGGGFLLAGLFFWALSRKDIRRFRDWRTLTGQHSALFITGPAFVRVGVLALVVGLAGFGLYHLVDDASYGSWLYGH